MYEVTVQATDSTMKTGMKEVMVEVADVDEMGMVTLSARMPQREVAFTAILTDPDGDPTGITWQWAKSRNRSSSYTDIENAESATYTPVDTDRNQYLRATAMYTDDEGSGKSAMAMSDYSARGVPASNSAPDFTGQDEEDGTDGIQVTRSVAENTAAGQSVGAPVRGTDTDGANDILTYTLSGSGGDDALFDINWATGQIMTKSELNLENGLTDQDNNTVGLQLQVTVRATDPSGDPAAASVEPANGAEVTVMITVTDVNEPPEFTSGEETYTIDEKASIGTGNQYVARDPDTGETAILTWSLSGPDRSKFDITAGDLTFMTDFTPDYEMSVDADMDNVYEVTVVATVAGMSGTRDVRVTVENIEEPGAVTLNRTPPRVGLPVTATLTDPDGSISGLTWQWSITGTTASTDRTLDGPIEGATSDIYVPKAGDFGGMLTATAMYDDGQSSEGDDKRTADFEAVAVQEDTRNKPPVFVDQDADMDGVQNTTAERKVDENTGAVATDDADEDANENAADNVGSAVTANDPDPNTDPLIYTLSGADAGLFRVRDNGQIEVASGTELDYEDRSSYEVTLTAEDSFGDRVSIAVTIMVTDMDEAPEIMRTPDANVAPEFASATTSRTVAENTAAGEDIGNPVAANDANGDTLSYTLGGADATSFDINPSTGQLMTLDALDYETKTTYSVTVTASESGGGLTDSIDVMVMVTNVDEMGEVSLSTTRPVVDTALTATLTDPDIVTGNTVTWQWSKSESMDGSFTLIDTATSMTYTPVTADVGYYLKATASYTDGHGPGKMAMETTTTSTAMVPADQMGTVTLSMQEPMAGMAITAILTDPDMMVTGTTWQWSKSMTMDGPFTDIDMATSMTYTPVEADEGYYLRATASYTDGHGPGKMAMDTTTSMVTVTAADPLLVKYDTNPKNGIIDKAEVITGIQDYFGLAISKNDVIRLIMLYFKQT